MSFLHPLAFLGIVAVAVPIWLHLRLDTDRVFPFPTVRFLSDLPAPRPRGFRLRDLTLLLARLLALGCIVAAFAWPFLEDERLDRITVSQVHLLDNTLSQQVDEGFLRDRDRVLAAIRSSPENVQNAVIVIESRPRLLVSFEDDLELAEQALAGVEPSFERGSYLESFRLADSLLRRSLGEKRIVVQGDHQENQWRENESTPAFLEEVTVELAEQPEAPSRTNLSLSEPSTRRVFLGEQTLLDLAVTLRWNRAKEEDPEEAAPVILRMEANEEVLLERSLSLDEARGQLTISAVWEPPDPSVWIRGRMSLEGAADRLPADDEVHFFLPPVSEGRVGLLARSRYLRAALAPETMRGRWNTRALDPSTALGDLPNDELSDVLVLEGRYAQSEQVRKLVFRHLNNGRGVVVFLERMTPLVRGFISELGLDPRRSDDAGRNEGFRFVAARHPIFSPFVKGELGDLLAVRIEEHRPLAARAAVPLLYGDSGDGLLFEGTHTKGRLLVFAFAFDREQTNWPVEPSFLPFLDLTLQYARGASETETSFVPGEIFLYEPHRPDRPDRKKTDALLREVALYDGASELARFPLDSEGRARIPVPRRPGLYHLTHDQSPEVRSMVSVNPDPRESVLTYLTDPPALASWSLPQTEDGTPSDDSVAAAALRNPARQARDQRLWYWLLVAGAAAVLLETGLLYRRGVRS